MNKYLITLNGCDDRTECEIELTKEEFDTFKKIAKEINKYSTYCCEPNISIYDNYNKRDGYFYYYDSVDLVEKVGDEE